MLGYIPQSPQDSPEANARRSLLPFSAWMRVQEDRGIIAGNPPVPNMDRADDLFGGPQGSPQDDCRCDSVAELIMLIHGTDLCNNRQEL